MTSIAPTIGERPSRLVINREVLVNAIFVLSVFPYFRLIPLGSVEVQPWASVAAGLYLLRYARERALVACCLPFLGVVSLYLLAAALMPAGEAIRAVESLAILLSPLLIFLALYGNLALISVPLFNFCVYSWAALGTLQMFAPWLLRITGVNALLSVFISRFSAESLTSGRGVTMFSPEPSYAAHNIFFMLLFSIFLYREERVTRTQYRRLMFLCFWMTLLNRSGSLAINLVLFVSLLLFILAVRRPRYLLYSALAIALCLLISARVSRFARPLVIVTTVAESVIQGRIGVDDMLAVSARFGSTRIPSVMIGYYNAFLSDGVGTGLGSWSHSFAKTAKMFGWHSQNAKPYAYAALVAFDMGFVGLLALTLMLAGPIFNKYRRDRVSVFGTACLLMALFALYANTMCSLPIYWIVLLLFFHDKTRPRSESAPPAVCPQ